MTLKEHYWRNGVIFRMSTGEYSMVWGDNLIYQSGYIPKHFINDSLVNTNSTIDEHVIEVYAPNYKAGYLKELIKPSTEPIWSKYDSIYTMEQLKDKLGIPQEANIIIISE